jgi:hypothetical protein
MIHQLYQRFMKVIPNCYICKLNSKTVKALLITMLLYVSASGLMAQQTQADIDDRIRKHYTAEEIQQLDALTIAQLNFVFRNSYVLVTEKPCPECPQVDLQNFDPYDYQRDLSFRKRIYLTNPGIPIDLLSEKELDAELTRIKNKFQSTH